MLAKGESLQELWWLHDALWYQGVARRVGFDVANEVNQEAIQLIAQVVMRKVVGCRARQRKTTKEVAAYFREASDLMWPPPMTEWEAEISRDDSLLVKVTRCFAVEGVKRLKMQEHYRCPCLAVRRGWFKGLRVKVEQEVLANMKDGAEACLIRVRIVGEEVPISI